MRKISVIIQILILLIVIIGFSCSKADNPPVNPDKPITMGFPICGFEAGTNTVQLNALPFSRVWYGLVSGDWIGDTDERIFPACFNMDNACISPDCLLSKINDDRLKESNFVLGRKISGELGSEPNVKTGDKGPEYIDNIGVIAQNDKIRVAVYVWNSANQNSGQNANDVNLKVLLSESEIKVSINASNTQSITDAIQYTNGGQYSLKPVQYFIRKFNWENGFGGYSPISISGSDNITIHIGTLSPSPDDISVIYIDFEVS